MCQEEREKKSRIPNHDDVRNVRLFADVAACRERRNETWTLLLPSSQDRWRKDLGPQEWKKCYIIIYFYGLAKRFIGTILLIDFPLLVGEWVGPARHSCGMDRWQEMAFNSWSSSSRILVRRETVQWKLLIVVVLLSCRDDVFILMDLEDEHAFTVDCRNDLLFRCEVECLPINSGQAKEFYNVKLNWSV